MNPRKGTRKSPLLRLIPYMARYRPELAVGSVMIVMVVLTGMVAPRVLMHVVDDLQREVDPRRLFWYAALILGVTVVQGVFRFWMRRILIGVSRRVEYDLRNDFLASVQKMSLTFMQTRSTGDMMSRATNDLAAVRTVLGPGVMYAMQTIITFIVGSILLIDLNWRLTLLAYVPMVLASLSVRHFGRLIHDRFKEIQAQFSTLSTKVQENIAGIRVVKAFARENSETAAFEGLNRDYIRRNISLIRLWGVFHPLMIVLLGLSSVALLWFGGRQVVLNQLTLGEFVAFMGYLSLLTWPTIAVGWVMNIMQRGSASMARILEIMDALPDIRNAPGAAVPEAAAGQIAGQVAGEVEFRNLSFQYPGASAPALRDIDLRIPAGTTLAVVGHTGSGKSTLASLIPRLLDPPPGTLFLDGRDVRLWPLVELRKAVGCVPQETFLFSDTVGENIAFGVQGATQKTEAEIRRAAEVSQIWEDIETFPDKMGTYIGERGITLSGGQKQRLAISRAVLRMPKILILDDSLSSVDTYTEERILKELETVTRGRTTLLVSHRVSTVRGADQIVVLKDGTIIERGTHETLLDLGGVYAELHQRQLLEDELAAT
ncbi:MAG: ABC transporter ATP-binding protein/permease [Acidobacteriota bacterium]|jgi:ATP-binding cassette subfamily B protein|nr:ABC transporter ATP-binding protein/permease [Acidobacteriota bacterium]